MGKKSNIKLKICFGSSSRTHGDTQTALVKNLELERMSNLDELTIQTRISLLNKQRFIDEGFGLCTTPFDNFKIIKSHSFCAAIVANSYMIADCRTSSYMFKKSLSKGSAGVSNIMDVRITRTSESVNDFRKDFFRVVIF